MVSGVDLRASSAGERGAPAAARRTETRPGRQARRFRPWLALKTPRLRSGMDGKRSGSGALSDCHVPARAPVQIPTRASTITLAPLSRWRPWAWTRRRWGAARHGARAHRAARRDIATLVRRGDDATAVLTLCTPQIFVTLRTGKAYPPMTVDVRCARRQRALGSLGTHRCRRD